MRSRSQQTQESYLQERYASLRQHPALRSGYREIFVHPIAPRGGGAQVAHFGRASLAKQLSLSCRDFVAPYHKTKRMRCLERGSLCASFRQVSAVSYPAARKDRSRGVHCCCGAFTAMVDGGRSATHGGFDNLLIPVQIRAAPDDPRAILSSCT